MIETSVLFSCLNSFRRYNLNDLNAASKSDYRSKNLYLNFPKGKKYEA